VPGALRLITPPVVEPVTLDDAKAHLRVDFTDDDNLITALITAARMAAEQFTRRAFITQTWQLTHDGFPIGGGPIYVPRPPLQSVLSVQYLDMNGNVQSLAEGTNYVLDSQSEPARIALPYAHYWPVTRLQVNAVWVQFTAGYGNDGTTVPAPIIAAIKLMLGHLYENRETVLVEQRALKILENPMGFEYLLWPFRAWGVDELDWGPRGRIWAET
jgi:uncharacterized phiE125 gp8 family phage protein